MDRASRSRSGDTEEDDSLSLLLRVFQVPPVMISSTGDLKDLDVWTLGANGRPVSCSSVKSFLRLSTSLPQEFSIDEVPSRRRRPGTVLIRQLSFQHITTSFLLLFSITLREALGSRGTVPSEDMRCPGADSSDSSCLSIVVGEQDARDGMSLSNGWSWNRVKLQRDAQS
ncbi:unnamed protein product [Pleuronectes platessa]|uniref:Uncharacterized protein n=1 Tax=Pleuronectes platessa TaxID=8262 RepID=A0A9N7U378_PLEPL|nr:unnamed protein product [Pleuronectes platessa]